MTYHVFHDSCLFAEQPLDEVKQSLNQFERTGKKFEIIVVLVNTMNNVSAVLVFQIVCCSPGFCVHEILQAKILEWVAISYSMESS